VFPGGSNFGLRFPLCCGVEEGRLRWTMQKFRMPLWALAWLAAVLAALVVFLANQAAVDRILVVTGLEKVLYPQGKSAQPAVVESPRQTPSVLVEPVPAPATAPVVVEPTPEPTVGPTAEEPSLPEAPLPPTPNTYRLYFLKLSPEGRIEPASFSRELPAGVTPLSATLKALMLGPTLQDKAQGALTMIPEGTKLLSVRLRDKVALVSFSEEFQQNTSGLEGLAGQLREVVWTATQFGSVDAVQILINGQSVDALGDGSISVAAPLTRSTVP
jgi:hypothetical protein